MVRTAEVVGRRFGNWEQRRYRHAHGRGSHLAPDRFILYVPGRHLSLMVVLLLPWWARGYRIGVGEKEGNACFWVGRVGSHRPLLHLRGIVELTVELLPTVDKDSNGEEDGSEEHDDHGSRCPPSCRDLGAYSQRTAAGRTTQQLTIGHETHCVDMQMGRRENQKQRRGKAESVKDAGGKGGKEGDLTGVANVYQRTSRGSQPETC